MHAIKKASLLICGLIGLFVISLAPFQAMAWATPLMQEEGDWIVLPDSIQPYTAPSFDAARADIVFKYRDQFRESPASVSLPLDPEWISFEWEGQRMFLPAVYLVRTVLPDPDTDLQTVDKTHGLPLGYAPGDLVEIDQKWNFHDSSYPKYLRRKAAEALDRMLERAEEQGVNIRIFSSYRSADKQRILYLNAVELQGIRQEWVAKPGHSEHQLGTTVDLCGLDPRSVGHQNFASSKEGQWLEIHAAQFGFSRSYTIENSSFTGYQSEPWHYRFRNY